MPRLQNILPMRFPVLDDKIISTEYNIIAGCLNAAHCCEGTAAEPGYTMLGEIYPELVYGGVEVMG